MLIEECYINFLNDLREKYPNTREAQNITDWVFEDILGKKKYEWKVLQNKNSLTQQQHQQIIKAKKKLIEEDIPIQYILKKSYFRELELYVNSHVLIPRPETEDLVQKVSEYIQEKKIKKANLLDIGVGSGCIAIALKKQFPFLDVYAIDISNSALEVAKKNASKYQLKIHFLKADVLSQNALSSFKELPEKIDIVVSNPPYIPYSRKNKLDKNIVHHEPHISLFVQDTDTIIFYKKILQKFKTQINTNTKFFFEIDDEAEILLKQYCKEENISYYFEKDRFDKMRLLISL